MGATNRTLCSACIIRKSGRMGLKIGVLCLHNGGEEAEVIGAMLLQGL